MDIVWLDLHIVGHISIYLFSLFFSGNHHSSISSFFFLKLYVFVGWGYMSRIWYNYLTCGVFCFFFFFFNFYDHQHHHDVLELQKFEPKEIYCLPIISTLTSSFFSNLYVGKKIYTECKWTSTWSTSPLTNFMAVGANFSFWKRFVVKYMHAMQCLYLCVNLIFWYWPTKKYVLIQNQIWNMWEVTMEPYYIIFESCYVKVLI